MEREQREAALCQPGSEFLQPAAGCGKLPLFNREEYMFFQIDLDENSNSEAHMVQINSNQVAKVTMQIKDDTRLYEFFAVDGLSLGKKEILKKNVHEISQMEDIISRG